MDRLRELEDKKYAASEARKQAKAAREAIYDNPEKMDLIISRYTAAPNMDTLNELANEFELTAGSLTSKLSRLGIYKKVS